MIKDFHPIFIQHSYRELTFVSPSFSILFLPFCEGCESKKANFPGKARASRARGVFSPLLSSPTAQNFNPNQSLDRYGTNRN